MTGEHWLLVGELAGLGAWLLVQLIEWWVRGETGSPADVIAGSAISEQEEQQFSALADLLRDEFADERYGIWGDTRPQKRGRHAA